MLRNRLIPCLLVEDRGLVKTQRFKSPKYVGDPVNAVRIFNDKEVDEIVVLDIDASRKKRSPDYAFVEQLSGECFMPLCYGGGVQTLAQADQLFALGVEKVCVQTAALEDVSLISRISEKWGNQAVVASIDVKRNLLGRPRLYSAAAGKVLGDWQEHMQRVAAAGAGEILLNAVDRDGTMAGVDEALIRAAASQISIPLIATGGVGSLADIRAALDAGASAVAAGSFFVFHGPHRAVLITYPTQEDIFAMLAA